MYKDCIVEELVATLQNGNKIKGNKTYENMLKRVSKDDIEQYCSCYVSRKKLYGKKIEMLEQIAKEYLPY